MRIPVGIVAELGADKVTVMSASAEPAIAANPTSAAAMAAASFAVVGTRQARCTETLNTVFLRTVE